MVDHLAWIMLWIPAIVSQRDGDFWMHSFQTVPLKHKVMLNQLSELHLI